jgi:ubiquinone biosynthesis protein COQ9
MHAARCMHYICVYLLYLYKTVKKCNNWRTQRTLYATIYVSALLLYMRPQYYQYTCFTSTADALIVHLLYTTNMCL